MEKLKIKVVVFLFLPFLKKASIYTEIKLQMAFFLNTERKKWENPSWQHSFTYPESFFCVSIMFSVNCDKESMAQGKL